VPRLIREAEIEHRRWEARLHLPHHSLILAEELLSPASIGNNPREHIVKRHIVVEERRNSASEHFWFDDHHRE
jgi:hypothetical protein